MIYIGALGALLLIIFVGAVAAVKEAGKYMEEEHGRK